MNPSASLAPSSPPQAAPAAATPAAPGLPAPARLAALGIDAEIGLRYCGGKAGLYLRLLEIFRVDHLGPFEERWRSTLRSEDPRARSRLVHTFKGVCLSVGAGSLGRQAEALETALAGDDPSAVESIASNLLVALRQLHGDLGYAVVGPVAVDAGRPLSAQPMESA